MASWDEDDLPTSYLKYVVIAFAVMGVTAVAVALAFWLA